MTRRRPAARPRPRGPGGRPPRPRGAHHRALRRLPRPRCGRRCPTATGSWPPPSRSATWPHRARSRPEQRTYLSLNRTGLAGSAFELDDRLVATVERAAADGWTGVKLMTRIDPRRPGRGRRPRAAGPGARGGPRRRPRGAGRAGGLAGRADVAGHRRRGARRGDRPRPRGAAAEGAGARRRPPVPPGVEAVGGWWPRSGSRSSSSAGRPRAGGRPGPGRGRDVMAGGGPDWPIGRVVIRTRTPATMARPRGRVVHRARSRVILTLDLGTSVTKAAAVGRGRLVGLAAVGPDHSPRRRVGRAGPVSGGPRWWRRVPRPGPGRPAASPGWPSWRAPGPGRPSCR